MGPSTPEANLDYPDMVCPTCGADTASTHKKGCIRNPVTVGDLIDLLSKFDRKLPVIVSSQDDTVQIPIDANTEFAHDDDDTEFVRLNTDNGSDD